MTTVFMTIVPLLLIPIVLLIPRMRVLAETRAKQLQRQGELVERYQNDTAKFLRLTESGLFPEHRHAVVWAGQKMLEGPSLVKALIFARSRWSTEERKRSADQVPDLPDDARHAFASATAAALLVSSYESPIMGRYYRAALSWIMSGDRQEVLKPDQVVYRYRMASHHNRSLEEAVC